MGVIAQGRPPAEVKDPNWPAFRYPPGGAPADGKVFASEDEVPKGWLDAPSKPAPPPPPPVVKTSKPQPKDEDGRWRREAVENAQRLVAMEADRDTLKARVGALESFIAKVGADENCPDSLKAAISELLPADVAPEPPESKGKRRARA